MVRPRSFVVLWNVFIIVGGICLLMASMTLAYAILDGPRPIDVGPVRSPAQLFAQTSPKPIAYITLDGQNYGTVIRVLVPGGALYLWAVSGEQPVMVYAPGRFLGDKNE